MRNLAFLCLSFAVLAPAHALIGCGDDDTPPGTDIDGGNGLDAGPDSGSGEVPLERAQAGGTLSGIAFEGDHAFIATGPTVAVWDISNPATPGQVGVSDPAGGNLTGIAVVGDRVYATDRQDLDGHVYVIDVSDPAAPRTVTSFRLVEGDAYSAPMGLAAADGRLYVVDQEHGITIFDLADPDAPARLQLLELPGLTGVRIIGSRLYYTSTGFLGDALVGALDMDANFADLGSIGLAGTIGTAITADNLIVGAGPVGLQVIDVTDFANPDQLYSDSNVFARALAVGATTAWVPGEDGLHVLDLSDHAHVTEATLVDAPTEGVNAASSAGGLLGIVTDRGRLLTFDVATPAAPVSRAVIDATVCEDCTGVIADGADLYLADFAGGLRTSRLRDLASIGRGSPGANPGGQPAIEDVTVADGIAYLADWYFGLWIYDAHDPTAPTLIGQLDTPGSPSAVAYADGKIYLGESTNGGALRIIDVTDPARPHELGAIATSKAMDVEVRDNLAFVADETLDSPGGLRIFDVSNPASIQLVGEYTGCEYVEDVALMGDTAIIACGGGGFEIIDISDPTSPRKIAERLPPSPNAPWAVAAAGTRAYLGHDAGVIVLDLTDPAHPTDVVEKHTPYTVRALTVPTPGRVVAACGLGGVLQWQIP